jgi:hypothetical protein
MEIKSVGKEGTIGQHFAELRKHSSQAYPTDGSEDLRGWPPQTPRAGRTARTVEAKALLGDALYRVSGGEYTYNEKYDDRYQHWPALFRYCREWEKTYAEGPYVEFKTEADCMSWAMHKLGTIDKAAAPIPWLAAIQRLRVAQKAQTRQAE